jgi:uncharacterized cupredoxin-like copper-binding protein
MRASKGLGAVAIAIALLASACGLESSPSLTIVAKDFAFSGVPARITGGPTTVTFRNEGQAEHEMAFLRIGDTSLETFKKEFPPVLQGGPIPDWISAVSVPLELPPGKSEQRTFTLVPGRYLMMCAIQDQPGPQDDESENPTAPPHYELGMTKWVDVEGESASIDAPDGEIVAKDYGFDLPDLKAGLNKLVFRNAGPKEFHFGAVVKWPAGFTEQQANNAFMKGIMAEEGQPPPPGAVEPEDVAFSGIFSPGMSSTWDVTFESGRTYTIACFIQDRTGGPPHAIKYKMFKAFTVK